jgi:hypothetical protein
MTTLVQYHKVTTDIAIFETEGKFWIGSYDPYLTHQTAEPAYINLYGNYDELKSAQEVLQNMTGKEF